MRRRRRGIVMTIHSRTTINLLMSMMMVVAAHAADASCHLKTTSTYSVNGGTQCKFRLSMCMCLCARFEQICSLW